MNKVETVEMLDSLNASISSLINEVKKDYIKKLKEDLKKAEEQFSKQLLSKDGSVEQIRYIEEFNSEIMRKKLKEDILKLLNKSRLG